MSSPAPVVASVEEALPVFPVDEGLLTTAATGEVVVVVRPTLEDGIDVVEVVVEVDVGVADVGGVVVVVVGAVGVVVTAARITTLKPFSPCPVTCPGVSPAKV
jgi:hypothetical protein